MPEYFLFIYLLTFYECFGILFFNSLTCDLRDAMPRHRSLTLLSREEEDFPRGDRHFRHASPLTYVSAYHQKIYIYIYKVYLSLAAGQIREESAPQEIRSLFTIS